MGAKIKNKVKKKKAKIKNKRKKKKAQKAANANVAQDLNAPKKKEVKLRILLKQVLPLKWSKANYLENLKNRIMHVKVKGDLVKGDLVKDVMVEVKESQNAEMVR